MLETILLLEKENYQKLKWVEQFTSKDLSRTNLNHIYVIGASLVGADGFTIGRIDIPDVLKDYCEGKKAFNIVKLATSPYLAVLEDVKGHDPAPLDDRIKAISKVIESTKDTTKEENRATSIQMKLLKRIVTMPSIAGIVDLYSESTSNPLVAVSTDGYAILMPIHKPGDPAYDRAVKKTPEKESG